MRRLGYDRYAAQGGDWGMPISLRLGLADPEHVAGVHLNMCVTFPPPDPAAMAGLDEADLARLEFTGYFLQDGTGLAADPVDPAADAGLRADRLAGRPTGLDRGEVQGVDRLGEGARGRGQPRPHADRGLDLLADRDRRIERPAVLRVQSPGRRLRADLGRAVAAGDASGSRLLPPGRGTTGTPLRRADPADSRALDGVRPRRPLRRPWNSPAYWSTTSGPSPAR